MSLSLQNSQVIVFAGFIRVIGVDALRTTCLQTMQPCTSEPLVSSHWTAIPACVVLWCFHPSHPPLPLALHLTHCAGLEFLELNLVHGGEVSWERLAALPALHSLMLVPPISPHSSGHGPEHAQQVRSAVGTCAGTWLASQQVHALATSHDDQSVSAYVV